MLCFAPANFNDKRAVVIHAPPSNYSCTLNRDKFTKPNNLTGRICYDLIIPWVIGGVVGISRSHETAHQLQFLSKSRLELVHVAIRGTEPAHRAPDVNISQNKTSTPLPAISRCLILFSGHGT